MWRLKTYFGKYPLEQGFKSTLGFCVGIALFSLATGGFMFWQSLKVLRAKRNIWDLYKIPGLGFIGGNEPQWYDRTAFWLNVEGGIYMIATVLAIAAAVIGYLGYNKKNVNWIGLFKYMFCAVVTTILVCLVIICVTLPDTIPSVVLYFLVYPVLVTAYGIYMLLIAHSYHMELSGH